MSDLTTWLRAQLDADELVARAALAAAGSAEWFTGAEGCVFARDSDLHVRGAVNSLDDIGAHIATWDPARVLAEIDAKRRILDWADTAIEVTEADSYRVGVEHVVQLLALPYAGGDGYRGS